jgi:hypothetical protein
MDAPPTGALSQIAIAGTIAGYHPAGRPPGRYHAGAGRRAGRQSSCKAKACVRIESMSKHRIFTTKFSSVYPHYARKAESKLIDELARGKAMEKVLRQ